MISVATELPVCGSAPVSVGPVGMRILVGEGNGWTQAVCTPTQVQDPGQSLNRGSFFTFIPTILQKDRIQKNRLPSHSTMMGRKSSIFRRGWWGPLGDGLLWVEFFLPMQATERPRKGACCSVSNWEGGRMVLSTSPRLLLLPWHCEPSWTTRIWVEAWCKIPLNAINAQSFPLATRSYKLYALISPETGRRRISHILLFYLVAHLDSFVYQSHKAWSPIQFWFRRRCFLLSFCWK